MPTEGGQACSTQAECDEMIPWISTIPWKKILTIGGIALGLLIPLILIIVLLMKEAKTA